MTGKQVFGHKFVFLLHSVLKLVENSSLLRILLRILNILKKSVLWLGILKRRRAFGFQSIKAFKNCFVFECFRLEAESSSTFEKSLTRECFHSRWSVILVTPSFWILNSSGFLEEELQTGRKNGQNLQCSDLETVGEHCKYQMKVLKVSPTTAPC